MLEKQKDIDAVVIATPDHMHAPIATLAMDLGKHVYVQKPLCWSVEEARVLAKKAKDRKVVTQMGNQGHSTDDARTGYELIASGAIGEVREVHVWTNRPLGYWPQGMPRPAPLVDDPKRPLGWDGRAVDKRLAAAFVGNYPKPDDLDWNLFLGGAPEVEYHPIYHPFNWRGWVDWGQGALGDMGAHLVDHPFWALNLGYPTTVETLSTPFNGASFPSATTTYYEFPKRGNLPPVKLTWYDGGLLPPKPEDIGDARMNPGGGLMYVGTKGKLLQDTYGLEPRLLPVAASGVEERAAAEAEADRPRRARDELGRGDQGPGRDLVALRIRGAAHRGHAARRRRAPRRHEDSLRRREDADHQLGGVERSAARRRAAAAPAVPPGLRDHGYEDAVSRRVRGVRGFEGSRARGSRFGPRRPRAAELRP